MPHTPGPWQREDNHPNGYWIHPVGRPRYWVGMAAGEGRDEGRDEASANANLIAAAPELLEACRAMVDEWDKLTRYGSPMAKAANERVAYARAAIAKAEGRA